MNPTEEQEYKKLLVELEHASFDCGEYDGPTSGYGTCLQRLIQAKAALHAFVNGIAAQRAKAQLRT